MVGARLFATASVVVVTATGGTACLSCAAPEPRQPVADAALTSTLDSIVEEGRNELALPGVSIAIMRGHTPLMAKGYGLADREARIAPTEYLMTAEAVICLDREPIG
jgi:CubicO group peptidase (beta-lactamase class C family)